MTSDLDVCRAFVVEHPGDAARVLERLPAGDVAALFEAMPPAASARVVEQMAPSAAADSLEGLRPAAAAAVVADLPTDLAASLLRRLDGAPQAAILEQLPKEDAWILGALLRYPEGSAGALMDPRAIAVAEDVSAREALATVRRSPRHLFDYVFVVDRAHRLVGVTGLRELVRARPGDPLGAITNRSVSRLPARSGRAAILAHPGWRHLHALPVVDEKSTFVGAIRYETLRTLESEARLTDRPLDPMTTVVALGELYWLGLSGLLDGLASMVRRNSPTAGRPEADRGHA